MQNLEHNMHTYNVHTHTHTHTTAHDPVCIATNALILHFFHSLQIWVTIIPNKII